MFRVSCSFRQFSNYLKITEKETTIFPSIYLDFQNSVRESVRIFYVGIVMILNYYLENRLTKKGECPIRLSAYVIKTRINTNIGYSVHPDSWDAEKQRMKPHKQNSKKQTSVSL